MGKAVLKSNRSLGRILEGLEAGSEMGYIQFPAGSQGPCCWYLIADGERGKGCVCVKDLILAPTALLLRQL